MLVVAGLVRAPSIICATPPCPPPHAGEGRVGAVAGTSPATTTVDDASPVPISIPNLVRFGGPLREGKMRLPRAQQHTRNLARGWRQRHFAIDELIVEADCRCLLAGVRVIERAESGPIDGAQAHRARLATRIDLAIRQMESAGLRAGATDGDDFGVGGGVAGRGDLVATFGHDDAVTHDHGSKWPAPVGAHAFQRDLEGALHEIFSAHAQCPALCPPIAARSVSPTGAR